MALTFCGASVRGYNTNIGWNQQSSEFRCSVVEDPDNNDLFNPPLPGTPIYFQHGPFYFFGLLQKWVRTNDTSGLPTFEVTCIDARTILDGTQIIIGAYRGAVNVANVLNAFGWWENLTGFGSSLVNDAGMPWYKIKDAIVAMTSSLTGDYGRALNYRGVTYGLDLTQLPSPPAYYRVPGPIISLMEVINLICEDGGCDYFVELVGTTIRIRTASRNFQQSLGAIASLQDDGYGVDLLRSSAGLESRNETTSVFLIGGEKKELYFNGIQGIQPYWGLDSLGNPIVGTGAGMAHAMELNATPVGDIVGGLTYPCTIFEMCCAMESFDTWSTYMAINRPIEALIIGVNSTWGAVNGIRAAFGNDPVDDRPAAVKLANDAAIITLNNVRSNRVWQFVKNYATEYMGKQFMVGIPFVVSSTDPETLKVSYSLEPSTDGGYLQDGASPLGLPLLAEDQFKTEDGKFLCFCLFSNLAGLDLSRLQGSDFFLGTDGLYLKCDLDPKVYFTPAPVVVVKLNNPLYEIPVDGAGNINAVAQVFGQPVGDVLGFNKNIAGGNALARVAPPAHQPDFIAIPLKSNIYTYGPWFLQGATGKVRVEYDSSLVPWNYGGFTYMNLAAQAKVTQAVSAMTLYETGDFTKVGPPGYSLGDTLQADGPNITNIDVSYGERGITTTYRLATFTPHFGVFSKDNAKRFERFGRLAANMRRDLRKAINQQIGKNIAYNNAWGGWLNNMNNAIARKSPHTTFISEIKDDPGLAEGKRVAVSSATLLEIKNGNGANEDAVWQRTAIMSVTGLLRPFSTNTGAIGISKIQAVDGEFNFGPSAYNYNPFIPGNDINELAWGQTYSGMHGYQNVPDAEDIRALALRGPLVVSGWGWTIDGKYVPGDEDGNPGTSYTPNTLRQSHLWKTGPVDLLYDQYRGVWTVHDILIGTLPSGTPLPANGSGTMTVSNGQANTSWVLTIHNWFSVGVSGGSKVMAGYCVTANKWYVVAADCIP